MISARKKISAAVLSIFFIFGLSTWGISASARIFPQPLIYETVPVYEYILGSQGVLMRVESGGCTNQSQFAFDIERDASFIAKLQVLRIKNDFCLRYMPEGQWLYFDYAEMGLKPKENFKILNPSPGAVRERMFPGLN